MTPDQDLSARLAELHENESQGFADYIEFSNGLINAYRSGQLITLADHTAAVQAAVAKAVEAEREACTTVAADVMAFFIDGAVKASNPTQALIDKERANGVHNAIAAIRSRGAAG